MSSTSVWGCWATGTGSAAHRGADRGPRARGADPRRSRAAVGASILAVLEQVIVPPHPEVQAVGRVARVRTLLVAVLVLPVSLAGLRDPTDAALEFEEEEMFDESIDRFEHSGGAPGASAALSWRDAAKTGGTARSRTANKSSTGLLFVEQNVDVPLPPGMSWQLCRSYHRGGGGGSVLTRPFFRGNC